MPALAGIERWEERERTERRHVSREEARYWPVGDQYDKTALCAIGPGRELRRLLTGLCARMWVRLTVHNFQKRRGVGVLVGVGGGGVVSNKLFQRSSVLCHGHTELRGGQRGKARILPCFLSVRKKEELVKLSGKSSFGVAVNLNMWMLKSERGQMESITKSKHSNKKWEATSNRTTRKRKLSI